MIYYVDTFHKLCAVDEQTERNEYFCFDRFDVGSLYIRDIGRGYKLVVNSFKNIISVIKTESPDISKACLTVSKAEAEFLRKLLDTSISDNSLSESQPKH